MCVKIGDLSAVVDITKGFPGTYKWHGGMSYYLDGDSSKGEIHFTVPGSAGRIFTEFHISRAYGGINAHVYYSKGVYTGTDAHLPSREAALWKKWLDDNESACDDAAAQFWQLMNTCT